MEHEGEIKEEVIEENTLICRICLSLGRKMFPLGQHEELYKKLLLDRYQDQDQHIFTTFQMCWECQALLQNVERFQNKIRKAYDILQSQEDIVSLSSLTTVVFSDSNPATIYLTEDCIQTDNINIEIDSDQIEDNEEIEDDTRKEKDRKDIESKKIKTKLARKRAKSDRKSKLKIVEGFDGIFKRVIYNSKVLVKVLEERRSEVSFVNSEFKCLNCIQSFADEIGLIEHNRDYHNKKIRKYICDICQSRFSDVKVFSTHLSNHYNTFYCKLCEFQSPSEMDARRHGDSHGNKAVECVVCCRFFCGRREFYDHYKESHEVFICDHCGRTFKMRYSLITHIRKKHTKPECKICDKKFSRYNGLWLHNKVFHGPPSESAYCVECDIKFTDIYRYKWHLANSIKHRPRKITRVPCPGCDKEFTKKIYMQNHYDLVHLKLIKFKCDDCQKYFGRNADLVKHRRRVHDGVQPPKNKICHICGRGFTTNNILANHVRTHTGERPFVCSRCPAAFAQAAALAGHMRNLHQE